MRTIYIPCCILLMTVALAHRTQRDAFVAKVAELNLSPAAARGDGNASGNDAKIVDPISGASLQLAATSSASGTSARKSFAPLTAPALPAEAAYVVRTRTSDVDTSAEVRSTGVGGAQYSETIVDVELSLVQKHHYRAILEQHRPMLRKVGWIRGLADTAA